MAQPRALRDLARRKVSEPSIDDCRRIAERQVDGETPKEIYISGATDSRTWNHFSGEDNRLNCG
jgi:hypothetical protein